MTQKKTVYQSLLDFRREHGPGLIVLLDPDRTEAREMAALAKRAQDAGAAAILYGTSFLTGNHYEESLITVKAATTLPVILFPSNSRQLTANADAVLLLSLVSSRNPQYLIGEQVVAAPVIKQLKLEAISTGYLLISSGRITTAEFMSGSPPIPRDKPELVAAHALASEQLGMKLVYLEAGSGAELAVPTEVIAATRKEISLPLIVGGGIRTPEQARAAVNAGADFIVIGTLLEEQPGSEIKTFVKSLHLS